MYNNKNEKKKSFKKNWNKQQFVHDCPGSGDPRGSCVLLEQH